MLSDDGLVYQFFLSCVDTETPQKDEYVMSTVIAILKEFFKNQYVSLVYICDTHDGRQAVRQRLFSSWFFRYPDHGQYDYSYKQLYVESNDYYVSLICPVSNPLLQDRKDALEALYQKISEK